MSTATQLVDQQRLEIKLGEYGVGDAMMLSDPSILAATQDYRRLIGSRMFPLSGSDIQSKVPAAEYHASRKVDGEFTVFVYGDGEAFSINPGGTIRVGLPWIEEAAEAIRAAGIKKALIAGELFVHNDERRPRVHDVVTVARGPQSESDLERLHFAVFDIISVDGEDAAEQYASTWQTIESLFGKGSRVRPVETVLIKDAADAGRLFDQWVDAEDAEGVVLRSDSAGMFKIKPRHNLDAVVIGFTESSDDRAGMMHDLLLAVMRGDGSYQVLCRVGGGFSDQERRSMLSDLKDMVVASEYAEVNSDYVAYQMVQPKWVIEISCLDIISQTTRGGDINRMVLDFDSDEGFKVIRRLPLATVISPQFIRIREDKQAHTDDVSVSQVTDQVPVNLIEIDAKSYSLPKSELLRREVFVKEAKGKTMVRKFVLLKTNKEEADADEYPGYVLHYTDFSPNRATPLSRDVAVSNSREQLDEMFEQWKADNIKKGWSPSGPVDGASSSAVTEAAEPQTKKATKKKAAKKKPAEASTETSKKATKKKAAKKATKKKAK
ncbi:MAG: hypothetical protein AAFU85_06215 [Planctomycetota bacterium]